MSRTRFNHQLDKIAFNHLKKIIDKFGILEKGSSVLIGVSGGVDSVALVEILKQYNRKFSCDWELYAAHVNPGFDNWPTGKIEKYLKKSGIRYKIIDAPIKEKLSTVKKNKCFFCARQRRRLLIEYADSLAINTIALAHHKEDVAETLFLNLLYGGSFATMVPRQSIIQGRFFFIRPLYFFDKGLIKDFARHHQLPVVRNKCIYGEKSSREEIRNFLSRIKKKNRDVIDNILHSITNIKTLYLP